MSLCCYNNFSLSNSSFLLPQVSTVPPIPDFATEENKLVSGINVVPSLSKNLCEDLGFASICAGNLEIPRYLMPQVSGLIKSNFLKGKEDQGIKVEKRLVLATQLTPVQNELSREKVNELVGAFSKATLNPCSKAILISSQNENGRQYVIDGHHRYAACRLVGGTQKVIAIDDKISNLLSELETFPGVRRSSLENLKVRK